MSYKILAKVKFNNGIALVLNRNPPHLTPDEFVRMLADPKHLQHNVPVHRIEFIY